VWRRTEVLRPHSANLRSHSPKQIHELARSIATFGFNAPILVDPTLRIIAGHGRLLAARDLGWLEVPTILLAHLSEAKARAFMIADNRLAEGAVWNNALMLEQLRELSLAEPDLAIEATGFELDGTELKLADGPRRRSRRPAGVTAPLRPLFPPVSTAEEAPDVG
jgi:ParB-like chromosome segregation protein Spo0J